MNWPTIIVAVVVAALLLAIVIAGIWKRKHGKSACFCGSSCSGCGMNGSCHCQK